MGTRWPAVEAEIDEIKKVFTVRRRKNFRGVAE